MQADGNAPTTSTKSAAGPVAGGVIGGIAVIALITFFVWRFFVKKKRHSAAQNQWPEDPTGSEKSGMDQFSMARDNRASTHTVASFASTVYTRASNIIQIAYIPGVTNRSMAPSPDLIPPVPPIPSAQAHGSAQSSPHLAGEDQHFFLPSDLRHSTFSNFSDRNSVAQSRNSVASTVYRNNAIVSPVPAQMVTRGKAMSVSVRSQRNSPSISRSETPPMPNGRLGSSVSSQKILNTQSSIVGRMGQPRPVQITRKGSNQSPIYELDGSGSEASYSPYLGGPDRKYDASPQYSHHSSNFDEGSSDEEYGNHGKHLMPNDRRRSNGTSIQSTPISPAELSTFSRDSQNLEVKSKSGHKKSTSLNQIIEEAARNASRDPQHGGLGSYEQEHPEVSPFADSHMARTP